MPFHLKDYLFDLRIYYIVKQKGLFKRKMYEFIFGSIRKEIIKFFIYYQHIIIQGRNDIYLIQFEKNPRSGDNLLRYNRSTSCKMLQKAISIKNGESDIFKYKHIIISSYLEIYFKYSFII